MRMIVDVPLRISLFGGGSDFPEFWNQSPSGGATLSMTIQKTVRVEISHGGYFCHSRTKILQKIMERAGIPSNGYVLNLDFKNLNSGLGSSSSTIIASLLFMARLKGETPDPDWVALNAAKYVLSQKLPQGIQDEVVCALGGFRFTTYTKDGFQSEELPFEAAESLSKYLFLTPIKTSHVIYSSEVLEQARDAMYITYPAVYAMALQAKHFKEALHRDGTNMILGALKGFGQLLQEAWKLKKMMSPKVSSPAIDTQIDWLLNNGVLGAKVCGAGGRGYILCVIYPSDVQNLRQKGETLIPVIPRKNGYEIIEGGSNK